jgi:hypothetical protein
MKTYGRGVSCTGQAEGGTKDAVFVLANGATLKNAIIGADQIEGVHCEGSCTIENVWWSKVCEGELAFPLHLHVERAGLAFERFVLWRKRFGGWAARHALSA